MLQNAAKNKFQKYWQFNLIGRETWNTFYANILLVNLSQFAVVLQDFLMSPGFDKTLVISV